MRSLCFSLFLSFLLHACCVGQTGVFPAGKRRLFLHCEGQRHGSAVVLEAGGWNDSTDWRKVQPEVARFTQVCSYDRDGFGKSTLDGVRDPTAETPEEHAEDLRRLLATAGVPPPYTLVGQSAGGMLVRRFAEQYRAEVVAMVLVDSSHEEQYWRFRAIDPSSLQGPPADPVRARRDGMLTQPGERLQWHDDIPLVVLEHGRPFQFEGSLAQHAAEFEACMHRMQVDLASRSSKGQLRTATGSGHDIMLDQPEMVVQAIRDVWGAAR